MTMALLLLVMAQADPSALMKGASARLSVPCGEGCAPPSPDARYRIQTDDAVGVDPKDRALADKGGRCTVVGDRICTRPPRTIFSRELRR